MGKKQQIKELEHELNWFADELLEAEGTIYFLKNRIKALESVIDEKQETLDGLKALNDSLLEILDSLPD